MNVTWAIVGTMLAASAITPAYALPSPIRYTCSASQDLTVQRNRSTARVNFDGHSYDLQRKSSSIGDKYISAKAALIIDGASAVFVTEDHLGLGMCVRAVPIASAR